MSAFTGDVKTMDCCQLIQKLEELAAEWRASPHLSNDYDNGVRYGELLDEVRRRCSQECVISGTQSEPIGYQLLCSPVGAA